MRRVAVVGNAGSGKTTVGRALAARIGGRYVELDSVHHLPGWRERPREEFRAIVGELAAGDAWVLDGNYAAVQDLVLARADTLLWFDLPRALVMRRLLRRTAGRLVLRRELWNGNREQWRNVVRRDPAHNILLWAWTQHGAYRERYEQLVADPATAHLDVVRLRSRADVDALLAGGGTAVG